MPSLLLKTEICMWNRFTEFAWMSVDGRRTVYFAVAMLSSMLLNVGKLMITHTDKERRRESHKDELNEMWEILGNNFICLSFLYLSQFIIMREMQVTEHHRLSNLHSLFSFGFPPFLRRHLGSIFHWTNHNPESWLMIFHFCLFSGELKTTNFYCLSPMLSCNNSSANDKYIW